MFTGIIEAIGTIASITPSGTNIDIWVDSPITHELKIDQSVAHNGVCLTVVAIEGTRYKVTAVQETLLKTNLNNWKAGDIVNLERAMKVGDRLDGHFVQGHVDAVATVSLPLPETIWCAGNREGLRMPEWCKPYRLQHW